MLEDVGDECLGRGARPANLLHIIVLHFELKTIFSVAVIVKLGRLRIADARYTRRPEAILANALCLLELLIDIWASLALPISSYSWPAVLICIAWEALDELHRFDGAGSVRHILCENVTKVVILGQNGAYRADTLAICVNGALERRVYIVDIAQMASRLVLVRHERLQQTRW